MALPSTGRVSKSLTRILFVIGIMSFATPFLTLLRANELVAPDVYIVNNQPPFSVDPTSIIGRDEIDNNARWVFKKLTQKGYRIHVVHDIDATDLLRIASDPTTVAIFHFGHGSFDENVNTYYLVAGGKPAQKSV